jgi:hypothetical protein
MTYATSADSPVLGSLVDHKEDLSAAKQASISLASEANLSTVGGEFSVSAMNVAYGL